MSETSDLRARAAFYRDAAQDADGLSKAELVRIAQDFDEEARRLSEVQADEKRFRDPVDRPGDA